MHALLVIDVQNDFCPGGALAVPEGGDVVAEINRLRQGFRMVVFTKDWHPPGHCSFASTHGLGVGATVDLDGLPQLLWPDHCVQNTPGAELRGDLQREADDVVIHKGTHPAVDSYSAFFDNGRKAQTDLDAILRAAEVDELTVTGLATDYCVKFTVLDALELGYRVHVHLAGCRGVEVSPGDVKQAVAAMREAGAEIT